MADLQRTKDYYELSDSNSSTRDVDEDKTTLPPSEKRFCGSRRNIVIAAIVLALIVAAIVGGVAGGLAVSKRKSLDNVTTQNVQDHQAPSPSPSVSPNSNLTESTNTLTPAPAPEPMRKIVTTQSKGTMFNIWQKANGDLWMRAYYPEKADYVKGQIKWVDPMKLETTQAAINNTSIAAAAFQSNDTFEIHIHYMAQAQQSQSSLVFHCNVNGTSCQSPRTALVSESTTNSPGVASFMLSPAAGLLHKYTVSNDGLMSGASYDSKSNTWSAAKPVGDKAKAHKASPLAAGIANGEIWLFWFDEEKKLKMATSVWKSSTWSQPTSLSTYTTPTELPRNLGIATSDSGQTVQVFFFDGAKMQQVQYARSKWTTGDLSGSVPKPSLANGPFGVVAYNDTVIRMYYPMGDGKGIKEVAEGSNGSWKYGGGWEDEYD
ncbi:hypothetical protein BKA63DRAFT_560794 [Paraphoma chrysanthemicola]|nr:hypothetical protein BKA63DRAFT_560794 [Paraphoma chrysanthemicola]